MPSNSDTAPDETETAASSAPSSEPPGEETSGTEQAPQDPLEKALAEAAQFRDKMLRTAADFDNFRKRTRREVQDAEKKGRDSLLKELLPVFDNLERATDHALKGGSGNLENDWKALSDGIGMVLRHFQDTLSRIGVERVESVGKAFDPALHEAIQHMETEEHPPGSVAAEVQAGYREGERLVRPALVVVAKAPASSGERPRGSSSDSSS